MRTFGCRLNSFESEIITRNVCASGDERLVVFNTCAVTAEAQRQARQAIRRAKREQPNVRIIVTGCAAQVDGEDFANMAEVDTVLGNEEKLDPKQYLPNTGSNEVDIRTGDIMATKTIHPPQIDGFSGRARAFVQIQNGCDHRCTFCIIPYGRGNSRSVPIKEVIEQTQKLVDAGVREIVLTGVDITSYGPDLEDEPTLADLVAQLLEGVPNLARLRLSSIDSIEVDDALFDLLANNDRIMPHLHLSLQSGDDMILKRMKRRHSRADAVTFCANLKAARPEMVFGADLIAGFPTETDEMFANTLALVEDCDLTYLHVFPYSPRPGTPAARMPQVDGTVIRDRAAQLRACGTANADRFHQSLVGSDIAGLVENKGVARSDQYTPIRFQPLASAGEIRNFHITGIDANGLRGEAIA